MSASPDAVFQRGRGGTRRPPIVRFTRKAKFDPALTARNGRSSFVNEDVAVITSPDGGVTLERNVMQWFREMREKPQDWGQWEQGFHRMYEDWKASRDPMNVNGTHLSNWPLLSPAQVENLLNAGITTIEEAADISDVLAAEIDGGLFIRMKARYWINAAADLGATAAEVAQLRADNDTLRADNALKADKLEQQRKEIERLTRMVTGKDGFEVISGRAQAVPLASIQATSHVQPAPPPAPLPTPRRPTFEKAASMSPEALRTFCYERNIRPSVSAEETLAALVQVGEIDAPIRPQGDGLNFADGAESPSADEARSTTPQTGGRSKGRRNG